MKIDQCIAVLLLGALSAQLTHVSGSASSQRHLRALGESDGKGDDDHHRHKVCTITNESQCDGQNWTFSTCCADDDYECRWDDKGQNVKRCQLKKKKKDDDDDDCSDDDKDGHGKGGEHQWEDRSHGDGKDGRDGKDDHGKGGKPGHGQKQDGGQGD
ncbi:hypothetical protein Gpo141_00014981, partial [Globisporangium polare]